MALVLNCWEKANSANTAVNSLTITKPTSGSTSGDSPKNVAANDLLVILVGNDQNDVTWAAAWDDVTNKPTGFTLIQEVPASSTAIDAHCAAFWRIADGTEGATIAVPAISTNNMWAFYILISGNDTTTPIHKTGAEGSSGTVSSASKLSLPSVTTTIDDCLAIGFGCFDGGDDGGFTWEGTGWTERDEERDGTGSGNASGTFATNPTTGQGATVAPDVYPAVADGMAAYQMAIAPAVAADTLMPQILM